MVWRVGVGVGVRYLWSPGVCCTDEGKGARNVGCAPRATLCASIAQGAHRASATLLHACACLVCVCVCVRACTTLCVRWCMPYHLAQRLLHRLQGGAHMQCMEGRAWNRATYILLTYLHYPPLEGLSHPLELFPKERLQVLPTPLQFVTCISCVQFYI